jgi:hypothetical protein
MTLNSPSRIDARRQSALTRQLASDALTPEQKLQNLDAAFGVGLGAKKERAKLQAKIQAKKPTGGKKS